MMLQQNHGENRNKTYIEWIKGLGFVDISPTLGSHSIFKRIITVGTNDSSPVEGCPTSIQYVGWIHMKDEMDCVTDNLKTDVEYIFETTRANVQQKNVGGTDDPIEFQLFRPDVAHGSGQTENVDRTLARPPGIGLDIGVSTMKKGEKSDILILDPELAYGLAGNPPKVLPNQPILFEVELLSWKEPLPRFPKPEELAATRKEQEDRARKEMEDNPPPTLEERLQHSNVEKSKGNDCFGQKDFEGAKKSYDAAFVHLFYTKEQLHEMPPSEVDVLNEAKKVLHLNRAMAKLKLNDSEAALWDCDQALVLDPMNKKGLFRRATVYTEKLKIELKKEQSKQFWIVDNAWKLFEQAKTDFENLKEQCNGTMDKKTMASIEKLTKLGLILQRYTETYHQQQKHLYHDKMFRSLENENKLLQEKEKKEKKEKEQEQLDLEGLPELED